MNKIFFYIIFLLLFSGIFQLTLYGQSSFESEKDLKKSAEKYFDNKDYAAAFPLYSQLLSLYPKDPGYNYKLGACMMFADGDKEAPIRFLEFAASKPGVDPEAFFYLGKAYHMNYKFSKAITAYGKFREKGNSKSQSALMVDRHIEMCENGSKLLHNITDIAVIKKFKLKKSDFFRSYELNDYGGKIIRKSDEFKSPYDLKTGEESVMYFENNADIIYYSSYGEKGKNGKDIYFVEKLPDGGWSEPKSIGFPVNTEYDEEYPFIHPDGKVLYFSSNGHNSMGGYDIFKSYFDEVTGTWSEPENMDFAINTPDDDFLFITDQNEKTAWFASGRETVGDEVAVYKIKLERIPVDISIIKGEFYSEITKSARITVEGLADKKEYGVYDTNSETGEYLLNLTNGGKYRFLIETDESPVTYSGIVELPRQTELKPLKQEISIVVEDGYERLIIRNLFDETDESEEVALSADMLKKKANLEVNVEEEEEKEEEGEILANDVSGDKEIAVAEDEKIPEDEDVSPGVDGIENLSNKEILSILYEDAQNIQKEADNLQSKSEVAYTLANEKNRMASEKSLAAETLIAESANISDPELKKGKLEQAGHLKKQSKDAGRESLVAYNVAKRLEEESRKKQEEATQTLNYAEEIDGAINETTAEETISRLNELKERMASEEESSENDKIDLAYSFIKKRSEDKRKEAENQEQKVEIMKNQLLELEQETEYLREQSESTRDKIIKEELQRQADELEQESVRLKTDIEAATKETERLKMQAANLEAEVDLTMGVVDHIKISDTDGVSELSPEDKERLEQSVTKFEQDEEKAIAEAMSDSGEEESREKPEELAADQSPGSDMGEQEAVNKPVVEEDSSAEKMDETENANDTEDDVAIITNRYEQQLEEVDRTDDELVKAEKKIELYSRWTEDMEFEKRVLRKKMNQAGSQEKKELLKKINELDEQIEEKNKKIEENRSLLALAQEENSETIASEVAEKEREKEDVITTEKINEESQSGDETSTVSSSTAPSDEKVESSMEDDRSVQPAPLLIISEYTSVFQVEMMNADKMDDAMERTLSKAEINEDWLIEVKREISELESELSSVDDQSEQDEINLKIKKLKKYSADKTAEIEAYYAVANQLMTEESIPEAGESELAEKENDSLSSSDGNEGDFSADGSSANEETGIVSTVNDPEEGEDKTIPDDAEEDRAVSSTAGELEAEKDNLAEGSADISSESITENEVLSSPYHETYQEQQQNAENIEDPLERAEKMAEIQENWIAEIENETQRLKETVEESDDRERIRQRIEILENMASEKRNLVSENKETVSEIKKEEEKKLEEELALEERETEKEKQNEIKPADEKEPSEEELKAISGEKTEDSEDVSVDREEKKAGEPGTDFDYSGEAYQENSIALKTFSEAREKEKEANLILNEVQLLRDSAVTVKKKKQREELIAKADEQEKSAQRIIREAEVINQKAELMAETEKNILENPRAPSISEKIALQAEIAAGEAEELSVETRNLRDSAASAENKKEEKELLALSREKETAALEKTGQADSLLALATELQVAEEKMIAINVPDKASDLPEVEISGPLTEEEAENLIATEEYKKHTVLKEKRKRVIREAEVQYQRSDELKSQAAEKQKESEVLKTKADNAEDEEERAELNRQAKQRSQEAALLMYQSDRAINIARGLETEAAEKDREISEHLVSMDANVYEHIIVYEHSGEDELAGADKNYPVRISPSHYFEQHKSGEKDDTSEEESVVTLEERETAALINAENEENEERENAEDAETEKPLEEDGGTDKELSSERDNISEGTADIDRVPPVLTRPVFSKIEVSRSSYSPEKPIPINKGIPKGLVFKVQVGAFRNPIPQDLFKGFAPVSGETTGSGITRYTAGMFNQFKSADNAKDEIRAMGYSDAFVVAYYNGKRISINEARRLIAAGEAGTLADNAPGITIGQEETTAGTTEKKQQASGNTATTDVSRTERLFYTVQVGVFSKQVNSGKMMEFPPLNMERMDNGFYRYSSGIYDNINAASVAKSDINSRGIPDAFVVAYYNGNRITPAEAGAILRREGNAVLAEGSKRPVGEEEETDENIPFPETSAGLEVVYKLQFGIYNEGVPETDVGIILELSSKEDFKRNKEGNKTWFYYGSFSTFRSADDEKKRITEKGVEKVAVIALTSKGEQIEVKKAREITGE